MRAALDKIIPQLAFQFTRQHPRWLRASPALGNFHLPMTALIKLSFEIIKNCLFITI